MVEKPNLPEPGEGSGSAAPLVHQRRDSSSGEPLDAKLPHEENIQVRKFARPSSDASAQPQPEGRIQRSTLTFVMSGLLVLCGSGGILAEIFHTSQAFQKGRADYASAANKGTAEALGEYWKKVSEALQGAEQDTKIAKNRSVQIGLSADAVAKQTLEQARVRSASSVQLGAIQRKMAPSYSGPYFEIIRNVLSEIETSLGPGHDVQLLVVKGDPAGHRRQEFLSVPWSSTEVDTVEAIECFTVKGFAQNSCNPYSVSDASVVDAFPKANDEPKQLKFPSAVPEEQKRVLGRYRRELEDLESALFYSALDLYRHKDHQGADDQLLKDELDRVTIGLQNVRRRFAELDEVEGFIERSEARERLPVLETNAGTTFAFGLSVGGTGTQSPSEAVHSWFATVPSLSQRASRDKHIEIETRGSEYYQSLRPLLANIWATWTSGKMSPMVVLGFRPPIGTLPKAPSGIFNDANVAVGNWKSLNNGVSARAIISSVGVTTALLALGLFFGFKMLPKYGLHALLLVAPLAILALAFPVQEAFTINQSTEKISLFIGSEVIPKHLLNAYTKRAAEVAGLIRVAGTDRASSIEESARAAASQLTSRANAQGTALEQTANVQGARLYSLMSNSYSELNSSCEVIQPDALKAKCIKLIDAAGERLKRFWEKNDQWRGQRPQFPTAH